MINGIQVDADPQLFAQYFAAVGIDKPRDTSRATLDLLQQAHLDRFCYSNIDVLLGRPGRLDLEEILSRLISADHGGACFHLNGSLALVLSHLGYSVELLLGTVSSVVGTAGVPRGNHLGLRVECDGETFLVDVGLGDAFRRPVTLKDSTVTDAPFVYQLRQDGEGDWHFTHDARGSFAELVLEKNFVELSEFEAGIPYLVAEDSPFRTNLSLFKRSHSYISGIRGTRLSTISLSPRARSRVEISTRWMHSSRSCGMNFAWR